MRVLIPILSMKEGDQPFLDEATKDCKEAILLFAVDKAEMAGRFGFASSDISKGNKLMESIAEKLKPRKILCDCLLEWGNAVQKIDHAARLKKVDKIVLQRQLNDYWKKNVSDLEKALDGKIKLEII